MFHCRNGILKRMREFCEQNRRICIGCAEIKHKLAADSYFFNNYFGKDLQLTQWLSMLIHHQVSVKHISKHVKTWRHDAQMNFSLLQTSNKTAVSYSTLSAR